MKMANLSQVKRQKMLEFLDTIREEHKDDDSVLIAINEIENELTRKKYGLVWEEHEENIDVMLRDNVPVFTEDNDKELHDAGPEQSYNFLLEGDNLLSLYLLEKTHAGRINLIYADPPYNTQNKEFIYEDTQIGYDDTFRHSKWLSFMNKRLRIARRLLADDGMIFISIDEHELAPLTMLCNEVFGEENFIDTIIWKKRYGGGAKEKYLVTLQEYILVYARDLSKIEEITVPLSNDMINRYYKMKDHNYEIRGGFRTHPLEANKTLDARPNLVYPIPAPDGTLVYPKRQWLWGEDRVKEAISKGEMYFSQAKDGSWSVQTKQYLKDENGNVRRGKFQSIIDNIYTQHGTNEMLDLFGDAKAFSYPKPSELIVQILSLCGKKEAIILDFFAGSGTTGHAVQKLNDRYGTNYNFILCTNNENNICKEITYERLKKVCKGYTGRNGVNIPALPFNLKYYRVDYVLRATNTTPYALMDHIKEMVQLEHGIDLDNRQYIILLDDDDADELEENWEKYPNIKGIYISSDVVLTAEQQRLFERVVLNIIPEYYFEAELREAGQAL